jgi:hypothetical protein
MGSVIQATKNWIEDPFREPVDALHVFLLTGLVVVSAILWGRILAHFGE